MKPEQLAEMKKLVESPAWSQSWWRKLIQDYEEQLMMQQEADARKERREHPGMAQAPLDDWEPPKEFDQDIEALKKALEANLEKALDAWYDAMGKVVAEQHSKSRVLRQVVRLDQLQEDVLMECLEKMLGLSQRHYE